MWTSPLLAAALLLAAEQPLNDLWKDPTFQKQFLGSYGFQAELEPKLTVLERQELEKILTLMATDTNAAMTALEKAATPDSSAVFNYTMGNLHFQQDELDAAASDYGSAVAKFPSFRRAWKNLGLIAVRQSRFDDAIKALSRVVELGGADGRRVRSRRRSSNPGPGGRPGPDRARRRRSRTSARHRPCDGGAI